jgi:hypothetical protein
MRSLFVVAGVLAVSGCAPSQLVANGQLYCAKTSADGPLIVALADALGAPVIVTGLAANVVAADCAAIDAIPVTPPANPAAAPVVAVALPPAAPAAAPAAPAAKPST